MCSIIRSAGITIFDRNPVPQHQKCDQFIEEYLQFARVRRIGELRHIMFRNYFRGIFFMKYNFTLNSEVMDQVERRSTLRQIRSQQRRSFDANLKIAVAEYAINHSIHMAAEKFGVERKSVGLWKEQLFRLRSANTSRKSFRGPKYGRFKELEENIVEFVRKCREEFSHFSITSG